MLCDMTKPILQRARRWWNDRTAWRSRNRYPRSRTYTRAGTYQLGRDGNHLTPVGGVAYSRGVAKVNWSTGAVTHEPE